MYLHEKESDYVHIMIILRTVILRILQLLHNSQ